MNEWLSLADSLEGDRSVGAVKMVLIYGRKRLPEDRPKDFKEQANLTWALAICPEHRL
jgi:hypothetical protein